LRTWFLALKERHSIAQRVAPGQKTSRSSKFICYFSATKPEPNKFLRTPAEEAQRAARLAAKLRALGLDPDQV